MVSLMMTKCNKFQNFLLTLTLAARLTSFPYSTIPYGTVLYGMARHKPYSLNPTYKFVDNGDVIDEKHVVVVDVDVNDVEDDVGNR